MLTAVHRVSETLAHLTAYAAAARGTSDDYKENYL